MPNSLFGDRRFEHEMVDDLARFQGWRAFVGWTNLDVDRVVKVKPFVAPAFVALVDDFYEAITRDPQVLRVVSGGASQIERLKRTLRNWLDELFTGPYDRDYVARRWRVGWRHVEIGLDQSYTNVALSRLRNGLISTIASRWQGPGDELIKTLQSVNRLLDLDLAIILDAYAVESRERMKHAERLRGEATFFRLVETAGVVIAILRPDKTIAYINPYGESLTGFSLRELVGKDYLTQFVPPSEKESFAEEIEGVLSGQPLRGYENSVICRDQSCRWIVWNAQRLGEYQGGDAIVLIGQDITVRKDVEERALRSERLAAIGQTVAGLAHESRNAFQRSLASLELLELELEGQTELLELVSRIQRALGHLHRLYEEVRDYAAPIKLDRQTCDLAHLWRDAWSHLTVARAAKSITLVEETNYSDVPCSVDWFAMGQVFRNIFENAIAACPEGGRVTVKCSKVLRDGVRRWRIIIRDSGPGIPIEIRARVFDAFFTTKPKGTGLGLAIVRRIVDAHGGTVEVGDSNEGCEFIVTLPV